ncbi:MAG: peptidase S10 [Rhodanobacter sp.]
MKKYLGLLVVLLFTVCGASALAADTLTTTHPPSTSATPPTAEQSVTQGSVTVEGQKINYTATAGTIILKNAKGQPTGSMFYVAYTKRGVNNEQNRPVTFFYNGGPGSSTIWLHMGAFGPRRVVTSDHSHTPSAPYKLVNNDYSLLDATDEVFIDMIGTGYSHIIGKDEGGVGTRKSFYGVDTDVAAFAQFINDYLSENSRWNSPKYIYGESYGTTRSAMLVNYFEQSDFTDLNGVILQSTVLDFRYFDFSRNHDRPYELILPSYAATAWFHHALPNQPASLQPFLQQVQQFALNDYAEALNAGSMLSSDQFDAIAQKLHDYTGLSVAYLKKAGLRVNSGEFAHELLTSKNLTVGREDSRFTGPSMDPLSQTALSEPQAAAISSAYATAFKDYTHNTLNYGRDQHYLPEAFGKVGPWDPHHTPYGSSRSGSFLEGSSLDASVDLAQALKHDPDLQVLVNNGYYDLVTPYFAVMYTMDHLDIPSDLRSHIHMKYYESGHMIYAHVPALKKLHDNTAAFIKATENTH